MRYDVKEKGMPFNEKTTDKIYMSVIGAVAIGAVVFCTIIKHKQKKEYK